MTVGSRFFKRILDAGGRSCCTHCRSRDNPALRFDACSAVSGGRVGCDYRRYDQAPGAAGLIVRPVTPTIPRLKYCARNSAALQKTNVVPDNFNDVQCRSSSFVELEPAPRGSIRVAAVALP